MPETTGYLIPPHKTNGQAAHFPVVRAGRLGYTIRFWLMGYRVCLNYASVVLSRKTVLTPPYLIVTPA